jgi:fructoselysine-6-P-deglycase FrlB-like protein
MSDEPQLRDGPPWAMEEMIEAQPGLPASIAGVAEARALAERIDAAAASGEPVLLTGCGTSEHAARAARAIVLERHPGAPVGARDAFEALLDPPAGGPVVGFSHEAGTRSTLAAVQASGEPYLVTAHPERVPPGVRAVPTPLHDRSWCHTAAYLSPLLTFALFHGLDVERAQELIAAGLAERDGLREAAARVAGCSRLLAVGSGVDEISAAELALKIEEAAHVPTTPLGAEKVLHGHLPAAGAKTGLVLLRFDPARAEDRDRRADGVRAAAEVLGMPTVTLAAPEAGTRAEALVAGALALQLLTLELSMALGTNPDLIRREEPLYRRAAEAGGVG